MNQIENLLKYFKNTKQSFLEIIDNKVDNLLELKEVLTKQNNFAATNDYREEISKLIDYKKITLLKIVIAHEFNHKLLLLFNENFFQLSNDVSAS